MALFTCTQKAMPLTDQIRELLELRAEYKRLRLRIEELENDVAVSMEQPQIVLKGIGLIKRRQKSTRTQWDHDALFSRLQTEIPNMPFLFDKATGEIESEREHALRILREAASFGWRVTPFRTWKKEGVADIDPDEYCVKTPGQFTVDIEEGVQSYDE